MKTDPAQHELELDWVTEDLGTLIVSAVMSKDKPEVEYQVHWKTHDGKQAMERVWLDACWSLPRMQVVILDLIGYHCTSGGWNRASIQKALNRVLITYGCEEPF